MSPTLYQADLRITTEDKNLHRHLRFFHSKLESNGLYVDRSHKFSEGMFSTPVIFKATSKLFSSQGCSHDKNWLDFPALSSRFVDFAVQFCFRCKFSFNEERRSSQVWQWRDFSRPITILCYASCATFLFLPHFDVICDLLLNRRTATWNLFVK